MSRGRLWTYGLFAATSLVVAPALAQDATNTKDRLSLVVRGKATQPADEVSIDLTVSASAEEATEAEKKYRDKLNRVLNALGKGDGKPSSDDSDPPKKHKKKKSSDDDETSKDSKKDKKKTDDDDQDATPKKKKAKSSDDDDDSDAPKKAKKKPASDDESDAPKKPKKKPADDDDDEDAPKKAKKDDAPKKDDPAKKDDPVKKDDAGKKDADKPAEEFPFVVEIKEGGLTFGVKGADQNAQMRRRMMGQQPGKEEPEFRFQSSLSIIFKSVAKAEAKALRKRIAEVLDKVSEAGVDTSAGADGDGLPPVVHFAVTDVDDMKRKAYEDGMAAARRRATNLASLSDRALGKVVTVRDQTALPAARGRQVTQQQYYYGGYVPQTQGGTEGDWSTEVVAEVDLYVEFELRDRGPNDPKPAEKK